MKIIRIPLARYYRFILFPGLLLLILPGLIRTYLLFPFPGSQQLEAIEIAYYLEKWLLFSRILGALLIIGPIINILLHGKWLKRAGVVVVLILCIAVFYFSEVWIKAEVIFQEPQQIIFKKSDESKVPLNALIIGVADSNIAKAYPVNYLAYHHKIQDRLGKTPILATYCSMCRSGRVFSPLVNDEHLVFRLVGASQYNAILEDTKTGSWWYQATGEAVIGPMKSKQLREIASEQMTLRAWLEKYPEGLIFQPSSGSEEGYEMYAGFDQWRPSTDYFENKELTWEPFSWVIGIEYDNLSKAYPWSAIVKKRTINDHIGNTPILIALKDDSISFHVWERTINDQTADFNIDSSALYLIDRQTGSKWNWNGLCVEGKLKGIQMKSIQSYHEFWNSWKTFHSETDQWEKPII